MKPNHIPKLLAVASTAAASAHAQSLVITQIYDFDNNGGSYTAGSSLNSNQTVAVGSSISDLAASAWSYGSYTSAGSSGTNYNQATGSAWIEGTAAGGDAFGRLAITLEQEEFGSPWTPGTTLWYSSTIQGGNIVGHSTNSGIYSSTPTRALRSITGDTVTLGVDTRDTTYNTDTGFGHGSTFLVSNAPDVTISGGTASWSVLDNSAADTDLELGSTMIDRNGGLLNLGYLLQDLSAHRALVSSFTGTVGSPFQDDVLATLTLKITGENAAGVTDTFTLGTVDGSVRFSADSTFPNLDFNTINGSIIFDPNEWADGTFTLTFDAAINQLAYGHSDAYLDSLLLGSLSTSQSFTLFTGAGISAVPEPGAFGLLAGLGALGFASQRRRHTRQAA